ncbi:alpha/beta hydrolase [Vibrio methylphosphonaticus]|uniref:alpha/beta hydrolase n=1 Tax=Vibrio methylphosphonaticus TaxID=2946866 RepID=UPI00202A0DCD|nr:alpha/beta hydrolase [Vibrio methylphosphonaticus]MCL9775516.1 alpha/beta hydrolase [Vibrio methylphosphonaticus]
MLFITNRIPNQSARSKKNRVISFNYQNTDISKWLYFCERHDVGDYTEILSTSFFARLKALPDTTQILFYLHGFNNNMESSCCDEADTIDRDNDSKSNGVFTRAAQLQALLDKQQPGLVLVIPIIWPCDDDSPSAIMDDYWDDQKAADHSAVAFARLFYKFDGWRRREAQQQFPCVKRMNVLAHSMGNRVLLNAMNTWVNDERLGGMPQLFRHVFMVAADVKNQCLEQGENGRHIVDSAKNVVVYYASDDLAMSASKVANLKHLTMSRRLGMTGPETLSKLPKKVVEVDCDAFNSQFDRPIGHSYFLSDEHHNPSPIIAHIASAIHTGRIIGERSQILE